jgi:hypothetical protein
MRKVDERIFSLFYRNRMKGILSSLHGCLLFSDRTGAWGVGSVWHRRRPLDDFSPATRLRAFYSISRGNKESSAVAAPASIRILGGGLAGLSVAYHLLSSNSAHGLQITILDVEAGPGTGGASAVAGG